MCQRYGTFGRSWRFSGCVSCWGKSAPWAQEWGVKVGHPICPGSQMWPCDAWGWRHRCCLPPGAPFPFSPVTLLCRALGLLASKGEARIDSRVSFIQELVSIKWMPRDQARFCRRSKGWKCPRSTVLLIPRGGCMRMQVWREGQRRTINKWRMGERESKVSLALFYFYFVCHWFVGSLIYSSICWVSLCNRPVPDGKHSHLLKSLSWNLTNRSLSPSSATYVQCDFGKAT